MIDIHTHIIPAIDDGSTELSITIEQLKLMEEAGVKKVIFTPHFIPSFYPTSKQTILEKMNLVREALRKENLKIELFSGAEILLEANSLQAIKKEELSLAGSRYVLVESNMTGFAADFVENLYKLVKAGYKPILAHPERYLEVQNNIGFIEELMYKNVYLQINAGSLLGHYGKQVKKTAWALIHLGWVHFMGSDNHCNSNDYSLKQARDLVAAKIDNHTAKLFTEINPAKIIENSKITMFYLEKSSVKEGIFSRLKKRLF